MKNYNFDVIKRHIGRQRGYSPENKDKERFLEKRKSYSN
jgi:hypothetical protein